MSGVEQNPPIMASEKVASAAVPSRPRGRHARNVSQEPVPATSPFGGKFKTPYASRASRFALTRKSSAGFSTAVDGTESGTEASAQSHTVGGANRTARESS